MWLVAAHGESGDGRQGWVHSRCSAHSGCLAHSRCSQKLSVPITILPGIRDAVLRDGKGTLVLGNVTPPPKKSL